MAEPTTVKQALRTLSSARREELGPHHQEILELLRSLWQKLFDGSTLPAVLSLELPAISTSISYRQSDGNLAFDSEELRAAEHHDHTTDVNHSNAGLETLSALHTTGGNEPDFTELRQIPWGDDPVLPYSLFTDENNPYLTQLSRIPWGDDPVLSTPLFSDSNAPCFTELDRVPWGDDPSVAGVLSASNHERSTTSIDTHSTLDSDEARSTPQTTSSLSSGDATTVHDDSSTSNSNDDSPTLSLTSASEGNPSTTDADQNHGDDSLRKQSSIASTIRRNGHTIRQHLSKQILEAVGTPAWGEQDVRIIDIVSVEGDSNPNFLAKFRRSLAYRSITDEYVLWGGVALEKYVTWKALAEKKARTPQHLSAKAFCRSRSFTNSNVVSKAIRYGLKMRVVEKEMDCPTVWVLYSIAFWSFKQMTPDCILNVIQKIKTDEKELWEILMMRYQWFKDCQTFYSGEHKVNCVLNYQAKDLQQLALQGNRENRVFWPEYRCTNLYSAKRGSTKIASI